MGRVHKKKIAEYAEAAENDLNRSDESVEDIKKDSDLDELQSEENDESHPEKIESVTDDEDFKSLQGDDEFDEQNENGASKNKRKASQKSSAKKERADDETEEEEPLATTSKKAKKSTSAGKEKSKKGAKGGKAKKKADTKANDMGEEEYEVKEIVDHKVENGVSLFLIRWKGYTKADDTWEAEDTLSCPDIIERFRKKQQANGKPVKKGSAGNKANKNKGTAKEDPNKEWEVEKIIDYAMEKGGRLFRIRWKGFTSKYDTWEPEENLYCDDIIEKFMKRMKTQENVTFKELREEPKKTKRLVNETLPRTNFISSIGRKSKRSVTKKRIYYGDSDE